MIPLRNRPAFSMKTDVIDIVDTASFPDIFVRFSTKNVSPPSSSVAISVAVDLIDSDGILGSMVYKYDISIAEDGTQTVTGKERVRLYRIWKNQCESRRLSPVLRNADSFNHVLKLSPSSDNLYSLLEPIPRIMNFKRQCKADMSKKWQKMLKIISGVRFRFFAKSSDRLNWFKVEYGIGGKYQSNS